MRDRLAGVARAVAGWPGVSGVLAGQDTAVDFTVPFSGPPQRWEEAVPGRDLVGYSWITMCPAAAAGGRLGGVGALRGSGAFWRVDELPGGGALLQATEHAEQYGQAAAEKSFGVLAPALPPVEGK